MRSVLGILGAALCGLALAGGALADPVADAEALVREVYYDEFPYERAQALEDAGVTRLGEMLADPTEAQHHGNIVLALGLSGHPDAFAILSGHAAEDPAGEVDRATFRARTHLPLAMGHLARDDRRALQWLLRAARRPGEPGWSFRHQSGPHLKTLLEEAALTGLGLSGAPGAAALLRAEARTAGHDVAAERRRRHAGQALALRDRIEVQGPDAVLAEEVAR